MEHKTFTQNDKLNPLCISQVLAAAHSALAGRGLSGDLRAERALVALLTTPITKYDVSTALSEC